MKKISIFFVNHPKVAMTGLGEDQHPARCRRCLIPYTGLLNVCSKHHIAKARHKGLLVTSGLAAILDLGFIEPL